MRAIDPTKSKPFPALVGELRRSGIDCEVLYLHAADEVLLKRYAETRRKHPLVAGDVSLREAIASERRLLEPIIAAADWVIDTSNMGVHALRELIRERVDRRREGRLSLDVRVVRLQARHSRATRTSCSTCAACRIPIGSTALRNLTGRDPAVIEYLAGYASVRSMIADLTEFLEQRVGEFSRANRSYLTIAIGCTGGQHRSVYIAEQLAEHFRKSYPQVLTRHDSLQTNQALAPNCVPRDTVEPAPARRNSRISSARARASA